MKDNNVLSYVKGGASILSGIGIAAIIGNAIGKLSPTSSAGAIMKVCITIGTAALGGMAADAGSKYLEGKIDEAAEVVSQIKVSAGSSEEENPIETVEV